MLKKGKVTVDKTNCFLAVNKYGYKNIHPLESFQSPKEIIIINMMKVIAVFITAAILFIGCEKIVIPPPTPNIVILGSSTAFGTGANPIDSAWSYRLQATVNKPTTRANFVNLALGGYSLYYVMPTGNFVVGKPVPDIARNITKALSYKPKLIILSFPTNDIDADYTDDEILSNYAKLAHLMDSAQVKYMILSTQPRDFADAAKRMRLKTLNDKVRYVYGDHVCDFLDLLSTSTYMIQPKYAAGDGIHLNNAGHNLIFNAVFNHPLMVPYRRK